MRPAIARPGLARVPLEMMDFDLVRELLEDPAYRHVLLNHLPVTGLAMSWICLACGAIEGRWRSIFFGLTLVAATSASAWFVMSAGDDAYPFIFDLLDGTGQAWLDHHTEMADQWGRLLYVNAVLAILAALLGQVRPSLRRLAAVLVLLTTLGGLASAALIAEAGGKIRHPEFRLTDPPGASGR